MSSGGYTLKVYGAPFMRTARVLFMLEELQLAYENIETNPRIGMQTPTPEYERYKENINRYGKVPTLVDHGFVLNESAAIVNYLCDQYGKGRYIPKPGSQERAQYDALCYTLMTELDSQSLYIHRKHVGLQNMYGNAPIAVEAAKKYFDKQFPIFCERLKHSRYFMGDDIMGIDILATHTILWAKAIGWYADDLSHVNTYLGRMCAKPSFRRAFEQRVPFVYSSGIKYVQTMPAASSKL